MKVLKKVLIISILMITCFSIPEKTFATFREREKKEKNEINPEEIMEEGKKLSDEEKKHKRGGDVFQLLSAEQRKALKQFIDFDKRDKALLIVDAIVFLILSIWTIKTKAVQASTKATVLTIIIGVAAGVFNYLVFGTINKILAVILEFIGVVLIILSYYYIFKHDNVLMYIPTCILGIYYSTTQFDIIADNFLIKVILGIIPIVLFIIGGFIEKATDLARIIPVKEKHERKENETEK